METIPAPDDTMPGFQSDGYHTVLNGEPVVYCTNTRAHHLEPVLTHVDPEGVAFWLYQGNAYRMENGADSYKGDAARDLLVHTWNGGWIPVGRWRLDRGQQDDVIRHPDLPSVVRAAATVLGCVE